MEEQVKAGRSKLEQEEAKRSKKKGVGAGRRQQKPGQHLSM